MWCSRKSSRTMTDPKTTKPRKKRAIHSGSDMPSYLLHRDLLERGWSRDTIRRLLGEPDSIEHLGCGNRQWIEHRYLVSRVQPLENGTHLSPTMAQGYGWIYELPRHQLSAALFALALYAKKNVPSYICHRLLRNLIIAHSSQKENVK